jgi:DDE family transposase
MTSVSQISEQLEQILEQEARSLAKETGFIKRERAFTGADFAQLLIFGWLQEPHLTLCGLSQVAQRREVSITAAGICQRFRQQAAAFMEQVLHRVTAARLQMQAPPLPLLSRFAAVIVEDSTTISLPSALHDLWPAGASSQKAALKVFVQWDLLSGALRGPELTQGRHADCKSPFELLDLPAGALYLADLGFFSLARLLCFCRRPGEAKRFVVTRYKVGTRMYTRSGHQVVLEGILPQQVGEVREMGVVLGKDRRMAVRLIMQRVDEEVAEQRRQRIREEAADHGREASEQALLLAGWSIVLTNVARSHLSAQEVLVLLAARWQIERLFWLWKHEAALDTCNSLNPWRILCECYAKLTAVVIQQWLIAAGCWDDPARSMVKAAQVVRRECNRVMVALWEGRLEATLSSIVRCMGKGCRQERRKTFPSTAQCLQQATGRTKRRAGPCKSHKPKVRYWPMGKGWACSGRPSRRKRPATFLT